MLGIWNNLNKKFCVNNLFNGQQTICPLPSSESIATLPPFSPIEGQKWFDQISSQWESQKNRFALIYFGKIQFLPPCIWNLPFMSTASVKGAYIFPLDHCWGAELWYSPRPTYRTLLSYTATYWASLHPKELCCTLLSYAAPSWATLHHTELPAPYWATLHPPELCFTLCNIYLSYARYLF